MISRPLIVTVVTFSSSSLNIFSSLLSLSIPYSPLNLNSHFYLLTLTTCPPLSSFFSYLLTHFIPSSPHRVWPSILHLLSPIKSFIVNLTSYTCISVRESQGAENVPQDPTGPGNLLESLKCVTICYPICLTPPTPLSLRGPSSHLPSLLTSLLNISFIFSSPPTPIFILTHMHTPIVVL